MANSLLYGVNNSAQMVIVGDRVNFGSPVRRYGKNITMSGGEVNVRGDGYYNIDASVTFVAGAAGIATVTLLRDGAVIPGASASLTVADASTYTINIPSSAIRQKCCGESTITAVISGVIGTITEASIRVAKE